MTMATKTEVLWEHLPRCLRASRKKKKYLFDHLEAVLSMHKALIRALRTTQLRDRWLASVGEVVRRWQ
jgi:hypothetical protein